MLQSLVLCEGSLHIITVLRCSMAIVSCLFVPPVAHIGLAAARESMSRQESPRARAIIVLTENAVGFENGGERFSSNRETKPLHVSKVTIKQMKIRLSGTR